MKIIPSTFIAIVLFAFALPVFGQTGNPSDPAKRAFILEKGENRSVKIGEMLFQENCVRCHNRHLDKQMIGPPLAGITERRERDWLRRFTKNSSKMVAEGDSIAVRIYEEHNYIVMDPFPRLTDANCDAIYHFIEVESEKIEARKNSFWLRED